MLQEYIFRLKSLTNSVELLIENNIYLDSATGIPDVVQFQRKSEPQTSLPLNLSAVSSANVCILPFAGLNRQLPFM